MTGGPYSRINSLNVDNTYTDSLVQAGQTYFYVTTAVDATGKEKSRMEVSKIEKKSIDDARFQVPAGYQTVNMDEMMKAMGGLRGGAGSFRPPR